MDQICFMQSIKFIPLEHEVKYSPWFVNPKMFLSLWEEVQNDCLKSIFFRPHCYMPSLSEHPAALLIANGNRCCNILVGGITNPQKQ